MEAETRQKGIISNSRRGKVCEQGERGVGGFAHKRQASQLGERIEQLHSAPLSEDNRPSNNGMVRTERKQRIERRDVKNNHKTELTVNKKRFHKINTI